MHYNNVNEFKSFTWEDKYTLLQAENARLKRQLRKAFDAMHEWKEQALYFQAERDHYREGAKRD